MSEATQAGERYRKYRNDVRVEVHGETGCRMTIYPKPYDGVNSDQFELADEYLRLTDPTLIDEAFIQSIGWDRLDSRDIYTTYVSARSMSAGPVVHISWEVNGGCDGWYVSGENIPPIETRGQLRMLCASLGIPLPPPSTE